MSFMQLPNGHYYDPAGRHWTGREVERHVRNHGRRLPDPPAVIDIRTKAEREADIRKLLNWKYNK